MDCKMNSTHQQKQQTVVASDNNKSCSNSQDGNLLPALSLGFLTFNCVVAVMRACNHRDYSMVAFVLFIYFGFMSLFYCLKAFDRLPFHEESPRKNRLKLAIWVLSTVLNFGLAIRFAPLLFPVASTFIFALATLSSAAGFYFFFIYRDSRNNNSSFVNDKNNKSLESSQKVSESAKIRQPASPLDLDVV